MNQTRRTNPGRGAGGSRRAGSVPGSGAVGAGEGPERRAGTAAAGGPHLPRPLAVNFRAGPRLGPCSVESAFVSRAEKTNSSRLSQRLARPRGSLRGTVTQGGVRR